MQKATVLGGKKFLGKKVPGTIVSGSFGGNAAIDCIKISAHDMIPAAQNSVNAARTTKTNV